MSSKPPAVIPSTTPQFIHVPRGVVAAASVDSLSREQRRNQELLSSLAFAQRSFTNLQRFLELVPLVAARLVGVEGAVLVPFQMDGRLWRDHLQPFPPRPVRIC